VTHAELEVGQITVFDVRGEKVGKITRIYEIDGVRYCAITHVPSVGFVEDFPRVGMARIYPNMAIPYGRPLPTL
jgi:hypothetical protein